MLDFDMVLNQIDITKREYENKLYVLRRNILRMVPERFRSILEGYSSYETRDELGKYYYGSIDTIVDMVAEAIAEIHKDEPEAITSWEQDRVFCPLCKEGNQNGTGLTVPTGLERHLKGYGNIQQCIAMEAAYDLANNYLKTINQEKF